MATIRITALPEDTSPSASDVAPIDGLSTRKATLANIVAAGRPLADQSEAEVGSNATKAMTPLTTKQSIASEIGVSLASKAQGDLASSSVQPGDIGTAAAQDVGYFATAAQGALADSAVQTVTGGISASVDNTDPQNLIVNFTGTGTGDILGPASAVDAHFALFDGTTGKLLKDGGYDVASFVQPTATDASGFGFVIDEDDMASDSATKVPTQQSVKAYADTKAAKANNGSDFASLPDVRKNLALPTYCADRTAAKVLDVTKDAVVQITGEGDRNGVFVFRTGDYSASVTADTREGIYFAPSSDATGASGAWVRQSGWAVEGADVRWFYNSADLTDYQPAIQAALNLTRFAKLPGNPTELKIYSSITMPSSSKLTGSGILGGNGSSLRADSTLNAPMIVMANSAEVSRMRLLGSQDGVNTTRTGQTLISLTDCTRCVIDSIWFQWGYVGLYLASSNSALASGGNDITNCLFYTCASYQFQVAGATDAGVDFRMLNTTFTAQSATSNWKIDGLGSALVANVKITGNSITSAPALDFNTYATLYGGIKFVNTIVESSSGGSMRLRGTVTNKWFGVELFETDLNSAGGVGLTVDYSSDVRMVGGILGSTSTNGCLRVVGKMWNTTLVGVKMACGSGVVPITNTSGAEITYLSVIAPTHTLSTALIDFSTATTVSDIYVEGGEWGTASTPIVLPTGAALGVLTGPLRRKHFVGTLDGSGAATVAHGLSNGQKRIMTVAAFYSSAGSIKPVTYQIDGSNIYLSAGAASTKYRVTVSYTENIDSNWS